MAASFAWKVPVKPIKRWFCHDAEVSAPVRLFYFPYAGGNGAAILPWQADLGSSVELWVAQLPGRGVRLFEELPRNMDELVAPLTEEVAGLADRPFAFFGHSLGALVAFEVARELRRQRLAGPTQLWASGAEGPQTRTIRRSLSGLPDAELIEALRDYGATPGEVLAEPEMMKLLLPGIRADFWLNESYRYRPDSPLELPILLLRGDADPIVDAERAAGWVRESSRPLREWVYPGDHFFIHPHRRAIAELVAAELTTQP